MVSEQLVGMRLWKEIAIAEGLKLLASVRSKSSESALDFDRRTAGILLVTGDTGDSGEGDNLVV